MGGGKGTRLYPLTKDRAKPAVPIAGKFRLIDIPISNCIHSEVERMFVLTQFNSTSLNRHIVQTYQFDSFSKGYVQILAAQQTQENTDWYQGTADAVRQNLRRFLETPCEYILILAGDHLYRMDYQKMLKEHEENNADVTVAVIPVERDKVNELGILKTNTEGQIIDFVEKPEEEEEITRMELEESILYQHGVDPKGRSHVASMGIYVFNKRTLVDCLSDKKKMDFGKHVIPGEIYQKKIFAHFFDGYWRDVGTIRSFFDANLELTKTVPEFDFYDEEGQVYTHPRYLPGSKINSCILQASIICEGSIITECEIRNSVIGVRSIVRSSAEILNSVVMGADYYDIIRDKCNLDDNGDLHVGIGKGSIIRNAIIDKNAKIGCNVKIINEKNLQEYECDNYSIRDGIVVVHKNAVLPDNTVI
ncbi:glucose-1-phosphate adenylyltransferase [Candidatus Poribacteria bacterium]|nr:glucose-1-phosphate adenylyltransferase [Candidatus Poribacteria bacterium]